MLHQDLEIVNKLGLHARAAAKLVSCAARFASVIHVEFRGQRVNSKSIMGIMMLCASRGTRIAVDAVGEDEADAMAAIVELVGSRFGEDE